MKNGTEVRSESREWTKKLEPGSYEIVGEIGTMHDIVLSYMFCCRRRGSDPIRRPWITFATDAGMMLQASVMGMCVKDGSGYRHGLRGRIRRAVPEKYENEAEEQWFEGEYDFRTRRGSVIIGTEPMFNDSGVKTDTPAAEADALGGCE